MCDKILEAKDPCFKQIVSVQLGPVCTAFGVTHKYGLTCLCLENQLCLIHTEELLAGNTNDLIKTKIPCQTIACNEEIIVVGYGDNVIIYTYPSVIQDVPKPLHNIKAKSNVKSLVFNPTDYSMIAVLSDDGNLLLTKINISGTGFQNWTLNDSKILSFCFSPKGKQLCVGHESGDLTQLKLDLTVAKKIKGPGGKPVSLLWISTSQFLVLTLVDNDTDINLVQVDLHKAPAAPTYVNFGDAFVSDTIDSNSQAWFNINNETIVCSSTTSIEIVVLVKLQDGNWRVADDIEDRRRAALPLDNYAVGGALYYNHACKVSFSESETYGDMPVYIIGSREGKFSCFSFVNKGGLAEHATLRENVTPLPWKSGGELRTQGDQKASITPLPQPGFNFTNSPNFGQQIPSTFGAPLQPTQINAPKPATGDSTLLSLLSAPITKASAAPQFSLSSGSPFQTPLAESKQSFAKDTSVVKPFSVVSSTNAGFGSVVTPSAVGVQSEPEKPRAKQDFTISQAFTKEKPSDDVINKFRSFQNRLAVHRESCTAHNAKFEKDEGQLSVEIEDGLLLKIKELEEFLSKMQHATILQRIELEAVIQKSVAQYSQITYAQSLEQRDRDPKYLQLVKALPMDRTSIKRFRDLEKKAKYINSQIQECQAHFYLAKCPPLKDETTAKYILDTIENHEVAINNLQLEYEKLADQLKLNSSVDELESVFRRTGLDEPDAVVKTVDMDELKSFFRRKNIIRLKTTDKADYCLSGGIMTNREGIVEGSTPARSVPQLPKSVRTHSASTQTDVLANELDKMKVAETQTQKTVGTGKIMGAETIVRPLGESFSFTSLSAPKNGATTSIDNVNTFMQSSTVFAPSKQLTSTSKASEDRSASKQAPIPSSINLFSSFGTELRQGTTSIPTSAAAFEPISPTTTESNAFPSPSSATSFSTSAPAVTTSLSSTMVFPKPVFGGGSFSFGSDSNPTIGNSSSERVSAFSFKSEATATAASTSSGDSQRIETKIEPTVDGTLDLTNFGLSSTTVAKASTAESVSVPKSAELPLTATIAKSPPESNAPAPLEGFKSVFSSSTTSVPPFGGSPSFLTSTPVKATPTTAAESTSESVPLPSFSFKLGETTETTAKPASTTSNPFGQSLFSFKPDTIPSTGASQTDPTKTLFGLGFGKTSPESTANSTSQPQLIGEASANTDSPAISFASLSTSLASPGDTKPAPLSFVAASSTSSAIGSFSFKPSDSTQVITSTSTGSTGLFGSTSLFSSPSTTTSLFGATSTSPFGQVSQQSGTLFGGGGAVDTAAKPAFGGPAVFGGSPFGSGGSPSAFSGSTPSSGSIFGSSLQPSSFGQFAQQTPPTSSAFGSSTLGTETSPKTAFGGPAVFGGSAFGSNTSFSSNPSSPPSGSIFGSSVQPASFGQFAQTQQSAFGSPSAPDSTQKSSFGSPSVFGGSPFGSTVFGSTSPSGSIFGGGTTEPVSFGQFAQQPPAVFGGAPVQEQKPASFGGASFSSWR